MVAYGFMDCEGNQGGSGLNMILSTYIIIHALAFIAGLLTLTLLAQWRFMQNLWGRTLTGAGAGVGSAFYLQGVAPFLSYIEAAMAGDLGFGGYFFLASFIGLIFVWGYNLIQTRGVLIQ